MTRAKDQNAQAEADEPSAETVPADDALAEALREATEAVDARRAERDDGPEAADGELEIDVSLDESSGVPGSGSGEVEALQKELSETQEKYVRLAADFDNFRKRTLKDRDEAHKYGHQNLVKDLLPSVDNLERAIAHTRKSGEGGVEGLLEGVELVSRELAAILDKHGVTPIDPDGEIFDPALHEAMAQAPDASVPPNTVVEVYQRGYQLRTRLLRPARVVVSKPPANPEAAAEDDEG
jgi:molecular chaperone GrpE